MTSNDYIQAAQVYVKQYTLDKTNSVHANTRQRYILGSWSWSTWYIYRHLEYWFVISIITAHANLQWKTNGGFLRSYFTTCMNRAHLVQAQNSIKWSAIDVSYWNNSCVFHMNILFEVYHIFISIGDFDRMVSPVAFLLMPLTLERFEMALSTRSVFIAFLLAFLFILDRQRKLTLIHKYIVPHIPSFHCTVHNFGLLTCASPQWTSCQISKIEGWACAGNAGNVFPAAAG